MSGISGPDGITPANNISAKTSKSISESKPKPLEFGGYHNPPAERGASRGFKARLSPIMLEKFENLCVTYSNVEFMEYPEEGRIPQLIIGDDFIEDVPAQEKCEV